MTFKIVQCNTCHKDIEKTEKDIRNSRSGKLFCGNSCAAKWRNVAILKGIKKPKYSEYLRNNNPSKKPEVIAKIVSKRKKNGTYKISKEHIQKLIDGRKGMIVWNYGLKGFMAGDKHPNWKGGKSKEYHHKTWCREYKEWRMGVFTRDNFTCQNCGKVNIYLTAHHIKSWTHFPDLRYVVNNGRTLCEECHSLTDNYKGRGRQIAKVY